MKHGRVEQSRVHKLRSLSTVRNILLMILFALGLMTNVASNIKSFFYDTAMEDADDASKAEGYQTEGFNKSDAWDMVDLEKELEDCESRLASPLLLNNENEISWLRKRIATIKILIAELRAKKDAAAPSKPPSCFTADMQVLTAKGAMSIAELKVGDKVLSLDAAGNRVAADVLKTFAAQENHYFLVNHRIKVTSQHRFFTDRGWKRACDLKIGDRLETADGVFEEIASIQWFAQDLDVYNLTVSENENFYISPDGRRGYLVHNGGGGK